MELKKLSASSLQSADMCLARYHAEVVAGYGSTIRNNYARLGSSVHGALEDYVRIVYVEKEISPDMEILKALYKKHYMAEFETADLSGTWFDQGIEMLNNWWNNADFSYFEVESLEVKSKFNVKTSIGMIPVTYVIDRLDYLGDGVWRVVDYKTSNEILTQDLLRKKIQARIYALAIQIQHRDKDIKEIWVQFDMLRFSPVSVLFTREDNADTYRMLQRAAERIIAAKVDTEEDVEKLQTLNPQCIFCIRKTTCSSVISNIKAGGVLGFTSLAEMVERRALFEYQKKAADSAMAELETQILVEMERIGEIDFETELVEVAIEVSKRKAIDVEKILESVPEEVFFQYGGRKSITVAEFDKLCKALSPALAQKIRAEAVDYKFSEPRVKVKFKGGFIK